jgi:quinolinate synthase
MTIKTLSSEISLAIEEYEALSEASPYDQELNQKIQELYDQLQKAEGKEWEESIAEYKEAKEALILASNVAQEAVNDLSKTAEAVSKAAKALDKLVTALALVL